MEQTQLSKMVSNSPEELQQQYNNEKKRMRSRFNWGIVVLILITLLATVVPKLVTSLSIPYLTLDVSEPNAIGDAIGGTMGPSVALIGAILTFLAFYAQIQANSEQKHQFRLSIAQQQIALNEQTKQFTTTLKHQESAAETQRVQAEEQIKLIQQQTRNAEAEFVLQDRSARRERFANRFYMMLAVHRDNVAAIDVGGSKKPYMGRRAFISMFNELKFIFWSTELFYKNEWRLIGGNQSISDNDLFQISYLTFFFGFGDVSTPMVLDLVGSKLVLFTKQLHTHFEGVKANSKFYIDTPNGKLAYENEYDLGTGHLRRLSHYFRHLYQTVKYVDDQEKDLFDYDKKYGYVSNLRAQLSTHEQLLLYYNTCSVLGRPWVDFDTSKGQKEGLLARYCLIKSIPLNAADFYIKPETQYDSKNMENKTMFEWNEIKRRMDIS